MRDRLMYTRFAECMFTRRSRDGVDEWIVTDCANLKYMSFEVRDSSKGAGNIRGLG